MLHCAETNQSGDQPFISRRCEDSWPVLYPPQYTSTLPIPLVDHQHLIGVQRIRVPHLCRLHPHRVHEDGARAVGTHRDDSMWPHCATMATSPYPCMCSILPLLYCTRMYCF